jgi:hypothetical protein
MLTLLLATALAANAPEGAPVAVERETKAQKLSAAAKQLFTERRYAEAIAKFRQSNGVVASTANLYNIGKCHERLEESALALRSYREYLRQEPTASRDEVLGDDIVRMEAMLREAGVQQLVVYARPPTARIAVDGRALTASPAYVELQAGEHELTVSSDGYLAVKAPIVTDLARSGEVTVSLRPKSAQTTGGDDVPRAHPGLVVSPTLSPRGAALAVVAVEPRPRRRVATWIGAAVAVAAGGAAVGLGVAHRDADRSLHTREATRTSAQTTELMRRTEAMATGANVAIGLAGAAAVTAVVLYFVEGR